MTGNQPFVFYTERRLVRLTGRSARNLRELRQGLEVVSGSAIFYHTHHQFLSQHFEKPFFHNEFANWVGRALLDNRLAEKLTAVDLLSLSSVRQIREHLIALIDGRLAESPDAERDCRPGDEFHFCESQSFLMRTGIVAATVPEFFSRVRSITTVSLFFHFVEARLRLMHPTNDFSEWLEGQGAVSAAKAVGGLDPYAMTLEELREEIARIGESEVEG